MAYYDLALTNIAQERVVTMDEKKNGTDVEVSNELEVKVSEELVLSTEEACIQYGREVMDAQLVLIKEKEYDFAPQFQELTVHLYLFGAIWKFAEGLDVPNNGRSHALSAIHSMLRSDGMQEKKAQKQIELIEKMSKVEDGSNAHAVEMGYLSEPDDNSLVVLFNDYVTEYQVSGDFWRLFERIKKTMIYGGLVMFFCAVWFVTLFLPGNSALSILAAGLASAAVFVIPTFLVGLIIFKSKMKQAKQQT